MLRSHRLAYTAINATSMVSKRVFVFRSRRAVKPEAIPMQAIAMILRATGMIAWLNRKSRGITAATKTAVNTTKPMRPGRLDNNLFKRGDPERFIAVTLVANEYLNRAD
jgi:hypothetical protein